MPMQIRARGNAFATRIGNWLIATFLYFVFVAFIVVVTFLVIFFFSKETTRTSLEDVDLLFGERALGTLPDDLNKEVELVGRSEHAEDCPPAIYGKQGLTVAWSRSFSSTTPKIK
jgi:hypothetical protein